jgi:hypothetical protein
LGGAAAILGVLGVLGRSGLSDLRGPRRLLRVRDAAQREGAREHDEER